MGIPRLFSIISKKGKCKHKKNILDSLDYEKNSSISNIDELVDEILNKSRYASSKKEKTVIFSNTIFGRLPFKKLISVVSSLILLFAVIASASTLVDPDFDSSSTDIEGTNDENAVFSNATVSDTNETDDSSPSIDQNESDENISDQTIVDENESTNETVSSRDSFNDTDISDGLSIDLQSDKNSYYLNETVNIFGNFLCNDSLDDYFATLFIDGPSLDWSVIVNIIENYFSYEFVPNCTGNYSVWLELLFENLSFNVSIFFDVFDRPWNDTDDEEPEPPPDDEEPPPVVEPDIPGTPFDTFEAPENSLGPSSIKFVNMTYFWNYFDRFSGWYLEAWDPDNRTWIDVTDNLDIDRNRSADNQFEKISLEFIAPMTADYRLTYIIDRPVKEFIYLSDQYEYQLTFSAGYNEEYTTYFNFSDIAILPNVILDHGVENINGIDTFWFSVQRNNIPQGTAVFLDPTFGNTATGSNSHDGDEMPGGRYTMGSAGGTATSITAYFSTAGGANSGRAAIYDSGGNLLTNGETNENTSVGDGWVQFDFGTSPTLTANADYYLVVFTNSDKSDLQYAVSGGNGLYLDTDETYPNFPATYAATLGVANANPSIYCTYTLEQVAPTQTGENPTNASTDITLTPTLNVTVDDGNDDTLTAYWYSNSSGPWLQFETNSSIDTSSGAVNIVQTNSNFSDPGETYWWSVNLTDSSDWANETYHFTTSYAPTLSNPDPANESVGQNTQPICSITVSDSDGGTVDVSFYENTTGPWILQQTNDSVASPAYVEWDNYNNASAQNTMYWWKVNVSDGKGNYVEEIYHFTTAVSNPPMQSGENPADASTNIAITITTINVTIEDPDGDPLNWTIETSPNIGSQDNSSAMEENGSKVCTVSGLSPGVTYTWYVNASDGIDWTNETYTFTTSYEPSLSNPVPANQSAGISLTPICNVTVSDSDGGTVDVSFYENTTGPWILQQTNDSVGNNYNNATDYEEKYWWKVNVSDGKGNYVEEIYHFTTEAEPVDTSVNAISPYTRGVSPVNITATGSSTLNNATLYYRWSDDNSSWDSWTVLTFDGFEDASGDPWTGSTYTDGGSDCILDTSGTYAHEGSNCANIQDDSGDASSFYHTNGIDVDTPGYTCIKADFWFNTSTGGGGWSDGEDWFVEYYNGTGWQTVKTYVYGTDFTVGSFYHEIVWINETDYPFPSNMQIKFRCDASGNSDDLYIDEIYVNATTQSAGGNGVNWSVWNNADNPDTDYIDNGWNWSFNFPNSTGYYEFYSIGKKAGQSDEAAPASADARCYYIASPNETIEITPGQWDQGTVTIGTTNETTGFHFNLTNEGDVYLNIQIKASNATNVSTGAKWELNTTPDFDNYSLEYNLSDTGTTWTDINLTYDTFVNNLAIGSWQTFDLKLLLATLSSSGAPLSVTVTFRSVAV